MPGRTRGKCGAVAKVKYMQRFPNVLAPVGVVAGLILWTAPAAAAGPPEEINLRRTVTVRVVEKTKPAVVNISCTRLIRQRASPFGRDPFGDLFDFGGGEDDIVRVHSG